MKANVMWGGAIKFAHSQLVCCSSFFFYYFFLLVRFSVLEAERRRKKGEKKSSSFFHRATYVSPRKLTDRSDGRKSIMPPRNKIQFFFSFCNFQGGERSHRKYYTDIYI